MNIYIATIAFLLATFALASCNQEASNPSVPPSSPEQEEMIEVLTTTEWRLTGARAKEFRFFRDGTAETDLATGNSWMAVSDDCVVIWKTSGPRHAAIFGYNPDTKTLEGRSFLGKPATLQQPKRAD